MKIIEALKLVEPIEPSTEIEKAAKVLAQGYKIRNKITNKPNIFSQENINNFFQDIDDNGIYDGWKLIPIIKIREFFKKSFKGIYFIPVFPFLSEKIKKSRETIN